MPKRQRRGRTGSQGEPGQPAGSWVVRWATKAEEELLTLEQAAEIASVLHAIEKLESQGTALRFPHQSAVRGTSASLRELRPRSGRSPVRAIYAQTGRHDFTVLAIGPDAKLNRRGFETAVRRAKDRLG